MATSVLIPTSMEQLLSAVFFWFILALSAASMEIPLAAFFWFIPAYSDWFTEAFFGLFVQATIFFKKKPSGSYKTHGCAKTKPVKQKSRLPTRPAALALAQEDTNSAPDRVDLPISLEEDDGFAFRFTLPPDGLALRSVRIVDGVPEIRFDASCKVPTITEEDVATVLRLASEGNRPEFFFIPIPPGHPFLGRQFNQYKPQWLRGTSVGNFLRDVDWSMKCLSIGARSNGKKFWSWQKTSQLEGLATLLDFPKDKPHGSIIMSCKSAQVQKSENELAFPMEPKMQIVADSSSLYSKYITEIYSSVAYHDEPRFLKMQEVIKLILAAEWLIEKGVRVSKKWMMEHTAKPRSAEKALEGVVKSHQDKVWSRQKKMIPSQPAIVKVPCKDVTVKTLEADRSRFLANCGVKFRYGWRDCGSDEIFDEDGAPCRQQKSLKMVFNHHQTVEGQPTDRISVQLILPLAPTPSSTNLELNDVKQLPQVSHQITDISGHMLAAMPCPPLALPQQKQTTSIKVSVDDYDLLFGHMDPNQPIRPRIPGLCDEITPKVETWNQLFKETVPWPHVWRVPYIGVGEPVATGGISTFIIPCTFSTIGGLFSSFAIQAVRQVS